MTGTLKTTLIQNPSSADVNITLGTSGEVTLAKSPVLNGSTSGTLTIAAPAVAGTNTLTLPASTGTVALTSNVIGVDQTWQDVSASRVAGTIYTNNTGKTIFVFVYVTVSATRQFFVNGLTVGYFSGAIGQGGASSIVPNGGTYQISAAVTSIVAWAELR